MARRPCTSAGSSAKTLFPIVCQELISESRNLELGVAMTVAIMASGDDAASSHSELGDVNAPNVDAENRPRNYRRQYRVYMLHVLRIVDLYDFICIDIYFLKRYFRKL